MFNKFIRNLKQAIFGKSPLFDEEGNTLISELKKTNQNLDKLEKRIRKHTWAEYEASHNKSSELKADGLT